MIEENELSQSDLSLHSQQSLEERKSTSDLSSQSQSPSPLPTRKFHNKKSKQLRDLISSVVQTEQARRKESIRDLQENLRDTLGSFGDTAGSTPNISRKSSEIMFENYYEKLEKLGQGGNSCVYRCRKIGDDSQHYAVKITKSDQEEIIRNETDISTRIIKLNHPNISKIHDLIVEKSYNTTYLIMELVSGCTLQQLIDQKYSFQDNEVRFIFNSILQAIQYLHSNGFVHRDITTSNVIYSADIKKVKIIDLSTSKQTIYQPQRKLLTLTGNDLFRAPEMFNSTYSKEVDIWSAGIILYYILFGCHPFYNEGDDMVDFVNKLSNNPIDWSELESSHFHMASQISLCSELLCKDPKGRSSAFQAMSHPFLKQRLCSKDFTMESSIHKIRQLKSIMRIKSCEELDMDGDEDNDSPRESKDNDKEKENQNKNTSNNQINVTKNERCSMKVQSLDDSPTKRYL